MTFEEVRDRAIKHCQTLIECIKLGISLESSLNKVWAYFDIGLLDIDEAMNYQECMMRVAHYGGTR